MKKLLFLFTMVAFGLTSFAQIISTTNGTWNNPNTWNPIGVPTASDDVIIGHTVTVAADASAKNITVNDGGNLQINSPATLTIPTAPPVPTVTNTTTGEIWMDRNLGASQVAASSNDELAYGDLYQWGRATEGHEKRTSETFGSFGIQATTAAPNEGNEWDGKFIVYNTNWLNSVDNTLWTETAPGGTNNPCPSGFRLPTKAEWEAEIASWDSQNPAGAFGSILKLPAAGRRDEDNGGTLIFEGEEGNYWSSSINGDQAKSLIYSDYGVFIQDDPRGWGYSVRCIKE